MINVSARTNTNIGKRATQRCGPCCSLERRSEPSWEGAGNPPQVLQAQTKEEVVHRLHSPSPQAVFHWHPAHPNTVVAYWALHISFCSSGVFGRRENAEIEMSKSPQPTERCTAHGEPKG